MPLFPGNRQQVVPFWCLEGQLKCFQVVQNLELTKIGTLMILLYGCLLLWILFLDLDLRFGRTLS